MGNTVIAERRRVVVTGMGVICPLGLSPEELWDALIAPRSGVVPIEGGVSEGLPIDIWAPASGFRGHIDDFGPLEKEKSKAIRKGTKMMCRECLMGVAAAQRAISHAGLDRASLDPDRIGIAFGTDLILSPPGEFVEGIRNCLTPEKGFEFSRWAVDGMTKMSPLWLLKYLPNMPASHVAIYNDFRGPNNSLTMREAAANAAVGEAFATICRDAADVMVVGATGQWLEAMKIVHATLQEELAGPGLPPAHASRPFDLHRSGMVLGEGAGVVVLEEVGHAKARGATIYGEITASATSSVANRQRVADRVQAMENVMRMAIDRSGMSADAIGHIHAHGAGTRLGDIAEAEAIRRVFPGREIPVVAAKSHFGNLGTGSGMVELVASLLALHHGTLFPVLNYQTPDPACPVHPVTESGVAAGQSFLKVSVTPQGQASSVLVSQFA